MAGEQAPAWAQGMQEAIILANREEVKPIKQKLEQCEARIATVESQQDVFNQRLSTLETKGPSFGPSDQKFEPTYDDIKGICDFNKKNTDGATRADATA